MGDKQQTSMSNSIFSLLLYSSKASKKKQKQSKNMKALLQNKENNIFSLLLCIVTGQAHKQNGHEGYAAKQRSPCYTPSLEIQLLFPQYAQHQTVHESCTRARRNRVRNPRPSELQTWRTGKDLHQEASGRCPYGPEGSPGFVRRGRALCFTV